MAEFVFVDKEKEKKKKRIRTIISLICVPVVLIIAVIGIKSALSDTGSNIAPAEPVKSADMITAEDIQTDAVTSSDTLSSGSQTSAAAYTTAHTTTYTTVYTTIATTTTTRPETTAESTPASYRYVLNTNTMRIHYPTCDSVNQMSNRNKSYSNKSVAELEAEGYVPCGNCHPR